MKTKYFIAGLVALFLMVFALPVAAQDLWAKHNSRKFLAVPAVYATNVLQITNFSTAGSVGTNKSGTIYTNGSGTRVVVSAAGAGATKNLLQDVPLWTTKEGLPAWSDGTTNGESILYNRSYGTVSVTMAADSGANAAVSFVVTPLWNGVNEASEAADLWTFAFTPTASTTHTFSTNAPLHKWPGAKALRLKRIVNADTDATSTVIITDVSLNGFGPP